MDICSWKLRLSPDHSEHLMPLDQQEYTKKEFLTNYSNCFQLSKGNYVDAVQQRQRKLSETRDML